jgi:hypothetical protein
MLEATYIWISSVERIFITLRRLNWHFWVTAPQTKTLWPESASQLYRPSDLEKTIFEGLLKLN